MFAWARCLNWPFRLQQRQGKIWMTCDGFANHPSLERSSREVVKKVTADALLSPYRWSHGDNPQALTFKRRLLWLFLFVPSDGCLSYKTSYFRCSVIASLFWHDLHTWWPDRQRVQPNVGQNVSAKTMHPLEKEGKKNDIVLATVKGTFKQITLSQLTF